MAEGEVASFVETLQGEQYTPEVKQGLSKFKSQDDVNIAYLNLEKNQSKPFKLPESFDKLPDDKTRQELQAGIGKLLGAVEKPEDLKDINYTAGMKGEKSEADPRLIELLNAAAVKNHWPKSFVQQLPELWNVAMAQADQQMEAMFKENADKVNKELIASLGSVEKVTEGSELVRRMFQNRPNMTPERFEQIGKDLSNSFIQNSSLTLELIGIAKMVQGEGKTESGEGGTKKVPEKSQYEKNKERWPNTPDLWGDPNK